MKERRVSRAVPNEFDDRGLTLLDTELSLRVVRVQSLQLLYEVLSDLSVLVGEGDHGLVERRGRTVLVDDGTDG